MSFTENLQYTTLISLSVTIDVSALNDRSAEDTERDRQTDRKKTNHHLSPNIKLMA